MWSVLEGYLMGCVWSSVDLAGQGIRVRFVKELAKGGFSEVLLCEDIDSKDKYAVKRIVATKEDENRVQEEINVLQLLKGAHHCVSLLASITGPTPMTYNLVFPFYRKGTAADELAKRREKKEYLDAKTIARITIGVCEALKHLHSYNFIHRDLKTANILLTDDYEPYLTDFGSVAKFPVKIESALQSVYIKDETSIYCSMPYRAPELFNCNVDTVITDKIDLWSLGCVLYALCYFVSPFDLVYEKGGSIALASQSPEAIKYPDCGGYDSTLLGVIQSLLKFDPDFRMSLSEVISQLQPYLDSAANSSSSPPTSAVISDDNSHTVEA